MNSESYGQDPSVRVSAGWVAGPNYGFDPVADYAQQIQEYKQDLHAYGKKIGCHEVCVHGSVEECTQCFNHPPKENLVIGVMPLPDHELDKGVNERYSQPSCMACQ